MGISQSTNTKLDLENFDTAFWNELLSMAKNKDRFYNQEFTHDFILKAYCSSPNNLKKLINKCCDHLSIAHLSENPESLHETISVVRVISRLISFCHHQKELDSFFHSALPEKVTAENGSDYELKTNQDDRVPLSGRIVSNLTNLLFYPGLCIPANCSFGKNNERLLWMKKVGASPNETGVSSSYQLDINRAEILRCLIVCFSSSLMDSQITSLVVRNKNVITTKRNKWIEHFVDPKINKMARTLFYSLSNTLCSFEYTNKFFGYAFKDVYSVSLQIFLVVLNYRNRRLSEMSVDKESDFASSEFEHCDLDVNLNENVFWDCFQEKSFEMFLPELLESIELNLSQLSLGSYYTSEFSSEPICLLWILVENQWFLDKLEKRKNDRLILLLFKLFGCVFWDKVDLSDTKVPWDIINMCYLILLKFSQKRSFGIFLNTIFSTKEHNIPELKRFENCCFADILFVFSNQIFLRLACLENFANSPNILSTVLSVICNVSPFVSSISLSSSFALMSVFERVYKQYRRHQFSTSSFIYFQHLDMILDVFNNFIQYQYKGCAHLVYSMVHKKEIFFVLYNETSKMYKKAFFKRLIIDHLNERFAGNNASLMGRNDESEWREEPKLNTIIVLINHLWPIIKQHCNNRTIDQPELLRLIEKTIVVGVLPIPHCIKIRKFRNSVSLLNYFTRFLWQSILSKQENFDLIELDGNKMFPMMSMK